MGARGERLSPFVFSRGHRLPIRQVRIMLIDVIWIFPGHLVQLLNFCRSGVIFPAFTVCGIPSAL